MKVTEKQLQAILNKLDLIEKRLGSDESQLSDFISEYEAKKLLNRGTTWFWNLRQSGFPSTKLGGQVYYNKKDLVKYFEGNTTN